MIDRNFQAPTPEAMAFWGVETVLWGVLPLSPEKGGVAPAPSSNLLVLAAVYRGIRLHLLVYTVGTQGKAPPRSTMI